MSARGATLSRRGLPATAGVPAPGDRRFRRPDVRPGSRRRLGRWTWKAAAIVGALGLFGLGAYRGVTALMNSAFLSVRRVAISGNVRLPSGDIEALLQDVRGQNIVRLDLELYRRRLMESPWVAHAAIRRVLPSTIEVRIVERTPMVIARVDSQLYLVDDTGVVIDAFGPAYRDFDLPIVDGLVPAAAIGGQAVSPERTALTAHFLDALRTAPGLRERVSQIDVSNPHDVVALLDDDPTDVHLGETNFIARLRTYGELAPTLQDRLRGIDYVDMRFDDRVYVKSKGQPAAARK